MKHYDALAMFSGGLDSILAAKTVQAQGLAVLGIHFTSPFFGHPDKLAEWSDEYDLDIEPVDVSARYVAMMLQGPEHGVGKGLNPCVDCKILMLSRCRELMEEYGAKFLVTGEVKGQRPMSQRRDALDIISRDAGVREMLLRPLCAKNMKPTPMEESGLVDRERLHNFGGRTRKPQFRLARDMGIKKIPQPAGGCKLTEFDSAKRYVLLFQHAKPARVEDFLLANVGRQFWAGPHWMVMGRNFADNESLLRLTEPGDWVLNMVDFPGPFGLARPIPGADWSEAALSDAAAMVASYCPKAVATGAPVRVSLTRGGEAHSVEVTPNRVSRLGLADVTWEELAPIKKAMFGETDEDDGY